MITKEEAYRRVNKLWSDLQSAEWELEQLGWRDAAKNVYGARLRVSEAINALPPLPTSSTDPKEGG